MSSGKKNRAKKRTQNKITSLLAALLIVLVILCAFYIVNYYKIKNDTQARNQALSEVYRSKESAPTPSQATEESATADEPLVLAYPRPPERVLPGFEALLEINPDTVGWLRIPQTTVDDIDLPVVQRDNSFYLTHDFDGNKNEAGAIFLDQANSIWPSDEHMILYGHNMKNGTMLARIPRYRSLDYAKNNPILYFDTLYESAAYVVLAAMQLPSEEMMTDSFNIRTFSFSEISFDAFLYEIRSRAIYVTGVGADENDQLLSVITCSYDENDERFLLMARRLREGETEEDIYRMAGKS